MMSVCPMDLQMIASSFYLMDPLKPDQVTQFVKIQLHVNNIALAMPLLIMMKSTSVHLLAMVKV